MRDRVSPSSCCCMFEKEQTKGPKEDARPSTQSERDAHSCIEEKREGASTKNYLREGNGNWKENFAIWRDEILCLNKFRFRFRLRFETVSTGESRDCSSPRRNFNFRALISCVCVFKRPISGDSLLNSLIFEIFSYVCCLIRMLKTRQVNYWQLLVFLALRVST